MSGDIPSNITVHEFGRAMAQLDLAGVPPEKRAAAIIDHLAAIMADTALDPQVSQDLRIARILHRREG